jgi:hypothetical protein
VPPHSIAAWCTPDDAREIDYVRQTVERTGGDRHRSPFGDPAVRTFARRVLRRRRPALTNE